MEEKKSFCSFCNSVIGQIHYYYFYYFSLMFFSAAEGYLVRQGGLNMKYSQARHLSCILLFPFFTSQS